MPHARNFIHRLERQKAAQPSVTLNAPRLAALFVDHPRGFDQHLRVPEREIVREHRQHAFDPRPGDRQRVLGKRRNQLDQHAFPVVGKAEGRVEG
jgi:hypothetical protein